MLEPFEGLQVFQSLIRHLRVADTEISKVWQFAESLYRGVTSTGGR